VYLDPSQFVADRPRMLLLLHGATFGGVKMMENSSDMAIAATVGAIVIEPISLLISTFLLFITQQHQWLI
jgi:hypothetical protein